MITAIIQARMSATRLPGKVLMKLGNKTILEHVVSRTKKSKFVKKVVVATSDNKSDDEIAKLCQEKNINYFRGSLGDVLDRYYQASKKYKAEHICRITADCPFIDPEIIDQVAEIYLNNKYDYVSTGRIKITFPDGVDTEIFSFNALERAWRESVMPSEREHVTPYIWKNTNKFKVYTINCKKNLSFMRWTVDEQRDLEFVREVYKRMGKIKGIFRTRDVLEVLEKNPELMKINGDIGNDEGYSKSINEDKFLIKLKKIKSKKIIINGKQIYLRSLTKRNATKNYCSWLNDEEVNKYLVNKYRNGAKATIKELRSYIDEKNKSQESIFLGIFYKKNNKHIGNIKLEPIDLKRRSAITGILIGDKNYWGRGVASEAIKLIITFSFKKLGLVELNLGVLPENKSARRVYEKNGFKLDRIKKKSIKLDGRFYDNYLMKLINNL
ncbi:MAG: GNAT family N-acetyltransferase [Patescibacteria group bacterium]